MSSNSGVLLRVALLSAPKWVPLKVTQWLDGLPDPAVNELARGQLRIPPL